MPTNSAGEGIFADYCNRFKWFSAKYNDWFSSRLVQWGKVISDFPSIVLGIAMIFAVLTAVGTATTKINEMVYVPQSSRFVVEDTYFRDNFGVFFRRGQVILVNKNEGDVINHDAFLEMKQAVDIANEVTAKIGNLSYAYQDVCWRPFEGAPCKTRNPLDFWLTDTRQYNVWNMTELENMTPEQLHERVSDKDWHGIFGQIDNPQLIFGGMETNDDDFITSARAMRYVINIDASQIAIAKVWEKAFEDALVDLRDRLKHTDLYVYTESTGSRVQTSLFYHDIPILIAAVCVMFVYTFLTLGRFDLYNSRVCLTLAGLVIFMAAFCAGMGLAAFLSLDQNALTLLLIPFWLISVGLHNMFVLVGDFEARREYSTKNKIKHRMQTMMESTGTVVIYTSVTHILTFLIAVYLPIPSVRDYCLQAALTLFLLTCLQMTAFLAVLVFDSRRVENKRLDICLIKTKSHLGWKQNHSFMREFIRKYYVRFIHNKFVRGVAFAAFLGLTGVCIWGSSAINVGLGQQLQVNPKGSIAEQFSTTYRENYNLGNPVFLVFGDVDHPDMKIDYTDPNVRAEITSMYQTLLSSKWIQPWAFSFWLVEFESWAQSGDNNHTLVNGEIPPSKFYSWLHEYLNSTDGVRFKDHVVFRDGLIGASNAYGQFVYQIANEDYVNSITETTEALSRFSTPHILYSSSFTYYSQFLQFKPLITKSLALLLGLIMIPTLLLYRAVIPVIISMMFIIVSIVDTLGLMYFWDIEFNVLSLLYILWTVAISLSFSSYLIVKFMGYEGTRKEKVSKALIDIGGPLFHAGITIFLGHLVILLFTKYTVFTVYHGRLFVIIIGIGLFHSLVVLPIVLTFVGPKGYQHRKKEISTTEEIDLPELHRELIPDPLQPRTEDPAGN
eukprot:TRINITY_DN2864_c0_g1_i1.p1 TRINITY_DN2864_c0_g1~~TRINITY_DN2864_c0_g1_i1.p1  ORF type:complete len:894 (-),score=135.15 TRINITY_DN2864_c0_g1_i1:27-2708(-)